MSEPPFEEEELARRATQSGPPPIEPEATPVLAKVLTFTGGAILLSGVALFTASQIRYSQAQSECPCEPGSLDEWQTMSNVSYGLMAGGGALALGGGIYWWVSTPGSSLSPGDGNPGDGSSREGGLTLGISGVF